MDWEELQRYTAQLKELLAGRDLSPDARAQSIAALILADALENAAHKMNSAAQTTLGDTMPLLKDVAKLFAEKAQALTWALENFDPEVS